MRSVPDVTMASLSARENVHRGVVGRRGRGLGLVRLREEVLGQFERGRDVEQHAGGKEARDRVSGAAR
jgi:hypothetical protein